LTVTRETVLVTPAIAAAWLARNTRNRTLSRDHVATFARMLLAGEWVDEAADPIRFDVDGTVREAAMVLGQQRPRTRGDVVSMLGLPNANDIAATLAIAWMYDRGGRATPRPSHQRVAEMVAALPGLADAGAVARKSAVRNVWPRSLAAWISWVSAGAAEPFVLAVAEGANLPPKSGELALSHALREHRHARVKPSGDVVVALAVKAANAWATARPMGLLRWNATRAGNEAFPTLVPALAARAGLTRAFEGPAARRAAAGSPALAPTPPAPDTPSPQRPGEEHRPWTDSPSS
jgi:hypothetical protein